MQVSNVTLTINLSYNSTIFGDAADNIIKEHLNNVVDRLTLNRVVWDNKGVVDVGISQSHEISVVSYEVPPKTENTTFGDLHIGDRFFDPHSGDEWLKVDFNKAYQLTGTDCCGLDDFEEFEEVELVTKYE